MRNSLFPEKKTQIVKKFKTWCLLENLDESDFPITRGNKPIKYRRLMHILFVSPNNKRFEIFCLINRFKKKKTVGAGNNDYYAIITASAATYYFWKLGLSGVGHMLGQYKYLLT